jgi:DNA polymerase IV
MTRKIIHVDMDAFYASVEQRDNPEWRSRPVVVGGIGERGVVAAASYEARRFGIHSAMPSSRARRLCPDAVWVRPDFTKYRAVSETIRAIFLRHTALVEPLSLDEAYLDVTEELTGIPTATEAAEVIRQEILDETALTASAGVAPNKFLAKIASDWRKPDGLFVIKPHHVDRFLLPLDVRKLPGVGAATEAVLHEMKIRTVADLRERAQLELEDRFGKFGRRLWELARGIDDRPVVPTRRRKSLSSENTFPQDITIEEVEAYLREEGPKVWASLEKRGLKGKTVTVKLRSGDFTTLTRQASVVEPVASAEELVRIALSLLERFDFARETRYRLAGVGVSNFLSDDSEDSEEPQNGLFELA